MKQVTILFLLFLCSAGNSFGETIPLPFKAPSDSTIYDNGNHRPSKIPVRELLPELSYDNANRQISFFSEESDMVFTFYICDNDNTLLSSEIALHQGERLDYSVLSLAPGTYSIGIIINGRNYEGEFEIAD